MYPGGDATQNAAPTERTHDTGSNVSGPEHPLAGWRCEDCGDTFTSHVEAPRCPSCGGSRTAVASEPFL